MSGALLLSLSLLADPATSVLGQFAMSHAGVEVCGLPVPEPSSLPPDGSASPLLAIVLCFDKQGGASLIDPATYLAYVAVKPSEPSRSIWRTFDDSVRAAAVEDFHRLWATGFLEDLSIEVVDRRLSNGSVAKVLVYRMEERQRVKIVRYTGLTKVDAGQIESALDEKGIHIRLDSFVDDARVRQISAVIRDLYAANGYLDTTVHPIRTPVAGGPKLIQLDFQVTPGPRVRIRDINFVGNTRIPDDLLEAAFQFNKPYGLGSLLKGGGAYQPDKYGDDAESATSLYRRLGYVQARVGQPEVRPLEDSDDGQTRWVQLRIPVDEGQPHRITSIGVAGNEKLNDEVLLAFFKLHTGDVYDEGSLRQSIQKIQEVYGAAGFYEAAAYPDLQRATTGDPAVDVVIRVEEGPQYFVNRITFVGNTHTQDTVVRRELGLLEGGVFNTEALKYSVRRLNQLGYFKALDGSAIKVDRVPGADNKVDVEFKLEEQNRNQLTFGAGISQYEGFFGNGSYTTSNFLGRGESLTVSLQKGARSSNYQIAFTEPFLFNRPITAGGSVYSRKINYLLASDTVDYSEVREGASVTVGMPLFYRSLRAFVSYGFVVIDSAAADTLSASLGTSNALGVAIVDGRRTQSSLTPSLVYNTVDSPYSPRSGMRLSGSYEYAGGLLGGAMNFVKPELEATWYLPLTRRTALGVHAAGGWLWNYNDSDIPYYLRYFLGGETSIRGYDLRTVGPLNSDQVPLGGNKYIQFNAELYYDIMPQVRAMLFHDAGQSFATAQRLNLRELRTSTGAELRVTLPVISVPFRLIYSWNFYRDTFQPARSFRFAVGTTF